MDEERLGTRAEGESVSTEMLYIYIYIPMSINRTTPSNRPVPQDRAHGERMNETLRHQNDDPKQIRITNDTL